MPGHLMLRVPRDLQEHALLWIECLRFSREHTEKTCVETVSAFDDAARRNVPRVLSDASRHGWVNVLRGKPRGRFLTLGEDVPKSFDRVDAGKTINDELRELQFIFVKEPGHRTARVDEVRIYNFALKIPPYMQSGTNIQYASY